MSYWEETASEACPRCSKTNYLIIAYAADDRANEWEEIECYDCTAPLKSHKCFAVFSAATPEQAESQLRRLQNRT